MVDKVANRGVFITIEGADGAGKSTMIEYLKTWLINKNFDVVATREPGGTRLGESLRKILLDEHDSDSNKRIRISDDTELMLMFSARMQHLQEVILPSMAAGRHVLCDRFTDATYAYQGGGRGMSEQRIQQLENWVQHGLQPDLTILLDVPVEVGLARIQKRGQKIGANGDRFEQQQIDFKHAVRYAYLQRAEKFPHRIKLIDASKRLVDVQNNLIQSVKTFLANK